MKLRKQQNHFALAVWLFNVLYSFDGTNGASPYYGAPVIAGTTLYGDTDYGGASNKGVIYSMNLDGSGYNVLHTFTGAGSDGYGPLGTVVLAGQTLYGTTYYGGTNGNGAVFAINTNGTGYTTLYSFTNSTGSGYKPYSTVTLDGGNIYGTTYYSGGGQGSIYSLNTNGTGYSTLINLAGGANSGGQPLGGSLISSGSTLYGMTAHGGSLNDGVIFSLQADGSGYTNLYTFTGGAASGNGPYGTVTPVGSYLYGMTRTGGSSNDGVVFRLALDGSVYTNLYTFTGGANSGINPNGSLTLSGSTFYGTTKTGGAYNDGVVFAIDLDGSDYTNLYSFSGSDGKFPDGDLTVLSNTLYGFTSAGGTYNDGIVFSLAAIPEPGTVGMMIAFGLGVAGWQRLRRWRA
jgi:uncharacterized repeat protein (TIGR03803 family)